MLIFLDGVYGVGKTSVISKLREKYSDNEMEVLESDKYYVKMLGSDLFFEKSLFHPNGIGKLPQNCSLFLEEFRKIILEKSKDENRMVIVDMALTMERCKKMLIDELTNIKFLHVILTADYETIRRRIINHEAREGKKELLDELESSILFLRVNYKDAIRIDTSEKGIEEVTEEVVYHLNGIKKMVF